MKTSFSLFVAFTSVTIALSLGMPAFAAMPATGATRSICSLNLCAAAIDHPEQSAGVIRVGGDDDEEGCDTDETGDEAGCAAVTANPAPAGTVAPPANGLFGNGAPPVAVTN